MAHAAHNAETYAAAKKEIWKITIILSVLTLIELGLGYWMYLSHDMSESLKLFVKGTILILMMAKAFYIVAYFMHLKHEVRNMVMSICVPLCLFIWFIIAFLYDGNSFKTLRNTYDPYYKEQSAVKAEKKQHDGKHDSEKHEEKKVEEKH